MKKICFAAVSFVCLLYLAGIISTQAVVADNLQKEKGKKECFYYALPENYFTVNVKIDKINTYKGPLGAYAGKITGLPSVIAEDAVHYFVSEVVLEVHSQIDRQQVYYVCVPTKGSISYRRLYNNVLLSHYPMPTTPVWKNKQLPDMSNVMLYTQNHFMLYAADVMMEKYDTNYVMDIMDSVVVYIPKITKRLIAKPTQQQAEEAMKTIETIREARWLLISGDHEIDYSNLERMLQELQKKEDDYLSLFKGITEKEELSYTFTIIPSKKETEITLPLFRFSDKYGLSESVDDSETIAYTLHLTIADIEKGIVPTEKKEQTNRSNKFLYYRKPSYYSISLYKGTNFLQDFGIYPISQFGETLPLPSSVYSFEIDSLTGVLNYIDSKK